MFWLYTSSLAVVSNYAGATEGETLVFVQRISPQFLVDTICKSLKSQR